VQRRLALDDPALDVLAGIRLRVTFDQVHAFHDQPIGIGKDLQHPPALTAILASNDEDRVVLSNWSR
jgi:hypothetical protein